MGKRAADFIDKVAGASLEAAEKKYAGLRWGRGTMFTLRDGKACALGIASLALCNSTEEIRGCGGLTDMTGGSRLGKRGAQAHSALKQCPLGHEGFTFLQDDFTAEEVVAHINDQHATSWEDCRQLLRRVARAERKAS